VHGRRSLLALVSGLLVVAALVAAAPSSSRPEVVAGRMEFLGAARGWQLLVSNTGTETIRCLRVVAPPGVTFTRVAGPPGIDVRGSEFTSRGLSIAPGVTFTESYTIDTSGPLTRERPPRVFVSADCASEVEAVVVVRDVTPTADPCTCRKLTVNVPPGLGRLAPDARRFSLPVRWSMRCSSGEGTCLGAVTVARTQVLPRAGAQPLRLRVAKSELFCRAPCTRTTTGRLLLRTTSSGTLRSIFGRTLVFTVTTRCSFAEARITLTVAVDATGRLRRGT
jgi:hypothetical protein